MSINTKKKQSWQHFLHTPLFDIGQFCLLIFLLVWFFNNSVEQLGYNWQWYRIPVYIYAIDDSGLVAGPLLKGLGVTLKISGLSLVFSIIIGLTTALLRLSNSFISRAVARFYLEVSRNSPLLIQIFFIYFVLGPILDLGRFFSAVLALSLYEGAYASEIFRSGILSIERGQWEAAHSLGLSKYHAYRFIILPQAIRRIFPPLCNQIVSLVKDSALVSTIAIYDLTMHAQSLISETFLTFEIWFTVAGMYLFITIALSFFVGWVERKSSLDFH